MMKHRRRLSIGLLLATCLIPSTASASVIALDVSVGHFISPGGNYTVGWTFTANENITVESLGYVDFLNNGLQVAHQVGLWNASGTQLLASTFVLPGTASNLVDGFRYEAISPIELTSGQDYVLGAFTPASRDPFHHSDPGNLTFTTAPQISYKNGNIKFGVPGFAFPSVAYGAPTLGDFGPNFQFSATAVPEPPAAITWGVLIFVCICICSQRTRRLSLAPNAVARSASKRGHQTG